MQCKRGSLTNSWKQRQQRARAQRADGRGALPRAMQSRRRRRPLAAHRAALPRQVRRQRGGAALLAASGGDAAGAASTVPAARAVLCRRVVLDGLAGSAALPARSPALETKNVLLLATADGHLRSWHATSDKFLGAPLAVVRAAPLSA